MQLRDRVELRAQAAVPLETRVVRLEHASETKNSLSTCYLCEQRLSRTFPGSIRSHRQTNERCTAVSTLKVLKGARSPTANTSARLFCRQDSQKNTRTLCLKCSFEHQTFRNISFRSCCNFHYNFHYNKCKRRTRLSSGESAARSVHRQDSTCVCRRMCA